MRTVRVLLLSAATAAIALCAGDAQKGKAIFEKTCRACHGAQGQGNPAIAKSLKVTLRDLASKEVQAQSDAELIRKAMGGYGQKKPVKTVTKEQMPDIIAFIRTLAK